MKKTTYLIIAIAIVLLVILGYVMFLFYSKSGDAAGNGNENDTGNACVELGCSEDDVYVGSVNSDKYYECSCRYAKNINPENIVCFKSDEEALADGRVKSEC